MKITLYRNTSEKIKVNKNIEVIKELNGQLLHDCSIYKPSIRIDASGISTSQLQQCNYCYIDTFGRYYYISNIIVERNNIWTIDYKVDVLMTYKTQILALIAVVGRQEKLQNGNVYLQDDYFIAENREKIQTLSFPEVNKGFKQNGSLVIAVLGRTEPEAA